MPSCMRLLLLSLAFIFTMQVFANDALEKASQSLMAGQFQASLNILEAQKNLKGKELAQKNYLAGICYARLGQFPKAVELLSLSAKANFDAQDLWYELGQVLYASNDLENSRKAFLKSIDKKFKSDVSHYYVAHISQVLEQLELAKKHYSAIIDDAKAQPALKQVAQFQVAEVLTAHADGKSNARELIRDKVLPLYEKALAMNPAGESAPDIKRRMTEVKAKYRLDPNIFVNGRPIPQKRYVAQLTEKVTYDNNMTLATDLPSRQASKKDSFAFKSTADLNYNWFVNQEYGINPGLTYNWTRHSDRDSTEVYTNDGWDLNLFVRNKREHEIEGKAATFNFNIDYDQSQKDRLAKGENIFFSRAYSFSVGESLSIFSFGPTAATLKYRTSKGFSTAADNDTKSLTLMQTYLRKNSDLMIMLFVYSQNRLPNAATSDTNSYLFSFSYIVPEIWPRFILNAGMSLTLLDTMQQKATRGTEKSWSPNIKITRRSGENLRVSLFYTHIVNQSLDTTSYDYNKQQYGFEFNYLF